MSAAPILTPETIEARRQGWLDQRRRAIGGTDVAAILGLSKFRSPMQVWLEKKGLAETMQNEAMAWGKRLERSILEGYADAVGHPIVFADPYEFIVSQQVPILGASLDARWADDDQRPVDAKNTRFKGPDWGEAGSDQIPVYYACQLAVQMHVTGAPAADLAVLFSGQQFERFTVYRDMETEAAILERVHLWWERHIVQDIPPDVDGHRSTTDWLSKRFRQQTDLMLDPTPELEERARALAGIKAALKELEAQEAENANALKAAIGEAKGIRGLCTWSQNKDSETLDLKTYANVLERHLIEYGMTGEAIRAIRSLHTTTKPGARTLRLTLKEAAE